MLISKFADTVKPTPRGKPGSSDRRPNTGVAKQHRIAKRVDAELRQSVYDETVPDDAMERAHRYGRKMREGLI